MNKERTNLVDKITRAVDGAIAGSMRKQLLFFSGAVVAVFAAFFAVVNLLYPPEEAAGNRFWNLVLNFIDTGGYEDTAGVAPPLIFLLNLCGMVLFGGMLVSVLTNIIERRIDRVKEGGVFYKWRSHVLILGGDPLCASLVKQLAAAFSGDIVVQTASDVPALRAALEANLDAAEAKRLVVVSGSRTVPEDILKLRVPECRRIFLFGEQGEADRDSKNIECLCLLRDILSACQKHVRCDTLFEKESTFAAFRQQDIPGLHKWIDFAPFNYRELWAKKIFVDFSYNGGEVTYTPLDREPVTAESGKRVHLVILGMNDMGAALAVQAAHICHFPNFITKGIKTKITLVDENAGQMFAALKCKLEYFFNEVEYTETEFSDFRDELQRERKWMDLEFEIIQSRFEEPQLREYLKKAAAEPDSLLTVAVCFEDSAAALDAALGLPGIVYDSGAAVLVYQQNSCAAVKMLAGDGGRPEYRAGYRKYANLRPFGMADNAFDLDEKADVLPAMIKYAYDNTTGEATVREFPPDVIRRNWQENWRDSDNVSALKASNRAAANYLGVKRRSLGIQPGVELSGEQISLAARMEHYRWSAEKLLLGFRAPTTEEAAGIAADKKREYYKARFIHEDLQPYDTLGEDGKGVDVRVYDINISRALPYMVKAAAGEGSKQP